MKHNMSTELFSSPDRLGKYLFTVLFTQK